MTKLPQKNDIIRVQSNIRDEIDKDRLKRYQREQKKSEEMEEALNQLSIFNYQPVDFSASLVRKQFTPPVIPDYSYMLTDARLKVMNKYNTPIAIEIILGIVCVFVSLLFMNSVVPIVGACGLIACTLTLYQDLHKRQQRIDNALAAAKNQINVLIRQIRQTAETARREFDNEENFRIEQIEKLLNGDPETIFPLIEETLLSRRLPFPLLCTIDYYNLEPILTFHLPDTIIIPPNIVVINSSGQIDYTEKSSFEINRQYSEVLAGTVITMAILLYAHIPTLHTLYVQGLNDRIDEKEYLFSMKLTREAIISASQSRKGLDAFHKLGAEFDIKTSGSFSPIQPTFPPWWETASTERIRTINVNLMR